MVNKLVYPQEIEVWYILPSIRKEIAFEMKRNGIGQKKIAFLLGVTESAISYYLNDKRAKGIKFDNEMKIEIKKSAGRIADGKSNALSEIQRIITLPKTMRIVCELHRKKGGAEKNCRICYEN